MIYKIFFLFTFFTSYGMYSSYCSDVMVQCNSKNCNEKIIDKPTKNNNNTNTLNIADQEGDKQDEEAEQDNESDDKEEDLDIFIARDPIIIKNFVKFSKIGLIDEDYFFPKKSFAQQVIKQIDDDIIKNQKEALELENAELAKIKQNISTLNSKITDINKISTPVDGINQSTKPSLEVTNANKQNTNIAVDFKSKTVDKLIETSLLKKLTQNKNINLSIGFDLLAVNNVKNTGYVNKFNFKSKYITTENRLDINTTNIKPQGGSVERKTEITSFLSDTRFEINDLNFFDMYNLRNLFSDTKNLKQDKQFQKIDFLKYTFLSMYSRGVITNERAGSFLDQKDIIYSFGPGAKYKIFYFSISYGVADQLKIIDVRNLSVGTTSFYGRVLRTSVSIEKNFKYFTPFDDEIKMKFDVSYNEIKNFSSTIQQNFSLSKKIDKYSTINLFYLVEDTRYNNSIIINQNARRERISLAFLFNFL